MKDDILKMTTTPNHPDDGESPFALEPLLVSEAGPHWEPLARRAAALRARDAELATCVPLSQRESRAELAHRHEAEASFLIEGEVADEGAIARSREALEILAQHPYLSAAGLARAHERLMAGYVVARPGQFRSGYVSVGRHVPVSPGAIGRCLDHCEKTYARAGRVSRLIGAAAGHHRLSWVHPFVDGNGRIARAATRARLMAELSCADLWALSEQLLARRDDYLRLMALADEPRRGDRDGRGNLSEERLAGLINFFFDCIESAQDALLAEVMTG